MAEVVARVPSDEELALSLPGGFRSRYADVGATRLHYVAGGRGEPLILLPGWPQTWWEFRKIMPLLARRFRVLAVDLRGMGGSAKPPGGYDKKTMAGDVRALLRALGYRSANIAGHDIGSMVAFSFAANFPGETRKIAMLDIVHPDESSYDMPLLRRPGQGFNTWWWAFNQVRGLPEQLLAGRASALLDWFFGNFLVHQDATGEQDRAIYAHAYDTPEAIRAANAWYQAFHTDIADMNTYDKLTVPLLGLASEMMHFQFEQQLPQRAIDVRIVKIEDSSHWLAEEQPGRVAELLTQFFS